MDGRLVFLLLQHFCQLVLSLWGFRLSFIAITNLQQYEETTKKAAKWSDEVARQLNKTKTTQSVGAFTIILSIISSLTLLSFAKYLNVWVGFSISPAMLVIVLLARGYIKSFWAPEKDRRGKDVGARIPLSNMEGYNEAVEKTESLLKILEYLEYSWLITSFVTGMVGYT